MEQYGSSIQQVQVTATSGGTTTLTNISLQIQDFTGSASQTVVLPDAATFTKPGISYEIYNTSTGTLTLQYQDTMSFTPYPTVAAGSYVVLKIVSTGTANGTWVVQSSTTSLPFTAVTGSASIAQTTPATQAISGSVIAWNTGSLFTNTLSTNTTFTFSGAISGQTIVVRLTNTASNYTVTWPTVRWTGGVAPTMSPGAVSDVYTFIYDGSNYYGAYVQDMS
jgi:hypothetical protein